MDSDRQTELQWRHAQDVHAQSDLLRQHAESECERAQLLTNRLLHTLRQPRGRPPGDHGEEFSLRVPRLPQAVGLVRHELRRWLDLNHVAPEDVMDITLACSEACANAVEHPGGSGTPAFELEARREAGELFLEVRDFGAWTVADAETMRGRGLAMIRQIMDAVEITSGDAGTQVAMRRTLRPVS
jgi:anti-sigma regulatory factor (Ser/Thr protein kinase)